MWPLSLLVISAQAIAFGIAWAARERKPRVLILGDYLAVEKDSKVLCFVVSQQDADEVYRIPIREFLSFLKGR